MGKTHLLIRFLGLLLVINTSESSLSSREVEVPMRMADDRMVVPDYSTLGASSSAQSTVTMSPEDDTEYQIYQGVMGRPGVDFPVYQHIPATSFSCKQIKQSGYYADLQTDCQVFHICDGGRKISFLCPNGTIFRQSHLICDWWFRVDCGKSVELYEESAEQLAADQQIYKARSEEREKRKKQVLAAHGEEEVPGLDEPYITSSAERKAERNSKKVINADFSNMYPGRQGKSSEESREQSGVLSGIQVRPTTNIPSTFNPRASRPSNNYYETFQQSASGGLVNSFNSLTRTQHVFAVDKSLLQTRTPTTTFGTTPMPIPQSTARQNYNFHTRKSSVTPEQKVERFTVQTRRPVTNYHTTPIPHREESEKQHFAESASFASHRGGRTFADFNHPNLLQDAPTTTARPLKFTYGTPRSPNRDSQEEKSFKLKKTIDRLKYVPFSSTSTVYKPTVPSLRVTSTTSMPVPSKFPFEHIYFTTAAPEVSTAFDTTRISTFYPTFESTKIISSSPKPDLDLSLQELNIQQKATTVEMATTKGFMEETRDGLEVPPSAGPSALRSFALYFAGNDEDKNKKLPFLPTNVLVIPIRKPVGKKSTTVLQQIDEVVKANNVTVQPSHPSPNTLPSSLTSQTKNSYSALFGPEQKPVEPITTTTESIPDMAEIVNRIQNNDLYGSQSRGIAEPDQKTNQINDKYAKIAPDLRELAQVFTKALSAYLDDPEAFRKALSQIRPTEPTPNPAEVNAIPLDYPSAVKEEDEVLDFSDVTTPSRKRNSTEAYTEATTEFIPTTKTPEISNYVLPLSSGLNTSETRYRVPETKLVAPFETLDESQSSYYTPAPSEVGTTNAIAEEINKEFSVGETLPEINSNEAVDSYRPVYGSVDDESRPRYGGFQNNTGSYSPYGAELSTTTEAKPTTYNPRNPTSALIRRLKEEDERLAQEAELVRAVNALVSRTSLGKDKLSQLRTEVRTTVPANHRSHPSAIVHGQGTSRFLTTTPLPVPAEANPLEINLELSPPAETEPPQGFFVTYSLPTNPTQSPIQTTVFDEVTTETSTSTVVSNTAEETNPPTTEPTIKTTQVYTTTPTSTTRKPTTQSSPTVKNHRRGKSGKSLERLMELQETLMFNTSSVTPVEKEKAREMVESTMSNMTMSDMTAKTLTKMMELAAKNETYRRLVLLLVNDRSGRNKSVEEARISLLRALLTPVINNGRLASPIVEEVTAAPRKVNLRKGKFIQADSEIMPSTQRMRVTTSSPDIMYSKTTARPRVVKKTTTTTSTTTTTRPSTVIGNLGLIRKTIEDSKTKDIRVNSLDDAVLDSDARAVELLRSLYSLAARWG